jgi:hypothetical protein
MQPTFSQDIRKAGRKVLVKQVLNSLRSAQGRVRVRLGLFRLALPVIGSPLVLIYQSLQLFAAHLCAAGAVAGGRCGHQVQHGSGVGHTADGM